MWSSWTRGAACIHTTTSCAGLIQVWTVVGRRGPAGRRVARRALVERNGASAPVPPRRRPAPVATARAVATTPGRVTPAAAAVATGWPSVSVPVTGRVGPSSVRARSAAVRAAADAESDDASLRSNGHLLALCQRAVVVMATTPRRYRATDRSSPAPAPVSVVIIIIITTAIRLTRCKCKSTARPR